MWSKRVESKAASWAGINGVLSTLVGFAACICGLILIGFNARSGHGLWSGLGLVLNGGLGLLVWKFKNKAAMVAYLNLNILLVVAMSVQAALAGIQHDLWSRLRRAQNCRISLGRCRCTTPKGETLPIAAKTCDPMALYDYTFLALCVFSTVGVCISLVGATVGCLATCCEKQEIEEGTAEMYQIEGADEPQVTLKTKNLDKSDNGTEYTGTDPGM